MAYTCWCGSSRPWSALGSEFFLGPAHRHWTHQLHAGVVAACSSKARQNHRYHHCPAARVLVLHVRGLARILAGIMAGWRERTLCSHWRHEQMAIQMALAAFSHHSALLGPKKARAREGDHEMHYTATVREHLPHPRTRPAPTFEVQPLAWVAPRRTGGTMEDPPVLQVFDAPAPDDRTISFLLVVALKQEHWQKEKEKAEEKEAETMARAALESLAGRSPREVPVPGFSNDPLNKVWTLPLLRLKEGARRWSKCSTAPPHDLWTLSLLNLWGTSPTFPARSGTSSAAGSALKDAKVPGDCFFALFHERKCAKVASESRPSSSSACGS